MARRHSSFEDTRSAANLLLWRTEQSLRRVDEDLRARGRAFVQEAEKRVAAGLEQLGENLAVSREAQRQGQQRLVNVVRTAVKSAAAPKASTGRGAPPAAKITRVAPTTPGFNAPLAGLKALQSTLFAGQDDKLIAGVQAILDRTGESGFFQNLHSKIERQEQLSADLQARFPVSSAVGAGVGLVGAVATGAPMATARLAAPRFLNSLRNGGVLGETPRLLATPRQHLTTAFGGGAVNAGVQGALNGATGEPSSLADMAGAFVGGAVGTRATVAGGPTAGAALEGFTTSIMQDVLNERPVSVPNGLVDAASGARLASLGDRIGTKWMERLPSKAKGKVGERLSIVKRIADVDWPNFREVVHYLPGGGFTRLDPGSSARKYNEAKAGDRPKVSDNQLRLRALDPSRYEIDWWHNSDIGKIIGHLTGTAGSHIPPDEPTPPVPPADNKREWPTPPPLPEPTPWRRSPPPKTQPRF